MQNLLSKYVGPYEVRQCRFEDLPQVIVINLACLPEHYSDSFFEELFTESPETFVVAELAGKIVGYIMCRIEYGFSSIRRLGLSRKGHIVSVAVLEEARNRGLGWTLIKEALEGMKQRSCGEAYLEVRVSNTGAVRLYEKMDFKITTKTERYYRDGEASYLMSAIV